MAQDMSSAGLIDLPVIPPPPGVLPDFDHPPTRTLEAYIGMGVCIGVTLVFIVLRLYVKSAITHQWGWDDAACIVGFVTLLAHIILNFTLMNGGLGTHLYDIKLSRFTKSYIKTTLAALNMYAVSAFFVKLSLFLLYLRLFKPNRNTRWLIYGGTFACGAFYASSIISNCVLCVPKPGGQNNATTWVLASRRCSAASEQLAIAQGVFSAVGDVYLLVIPIHSIFRLRLPLNRKIGVSAIFMIGIIAIVCSLSSLAYRIKLLKIVDTTWLALPVWILSVTELSAGIVCSCTPVLAALFRTGTPRRYHFPSICNFRLPLFTLHSSRSSRRPFVPDARLAAGKSQIRRSSELKAGTYVALEDGTYLMKPQDVFKASKSVETF